MSRFADADGVFSTSDGSGDDGDASPTTDPTAADDGTDGGPTTAPTTSNDSAADGPATADGADDAADAGGTTGADDGQDGGSSGSVDEGGTTSDTGTSDAGDTAIDDDVDLSGWTVVQTNSAREFVLPDGTIVPRGGTLVIARDASPGAFQAFWGVNWGDDVVYVDGMTRFRRSTATRPTRCARPTGRSPRGRRPRSARHRARAHRRGRAAGDAGAWAVDLAPNDDATPGTSVATGGASGRPTSRSSPTRSAPATTSTSSSRSASRRSRACPSCYAAKMELALIPFVLPLLLLGRVIERFAPAERDDPDRRTGVADRVERPRGAICAHRSDHSRIAAAAATLSESTAPAIGTCTAV